MLIWKKHLLIDKIPNALPGAHPKCHSMKNIPFLKRSNTLLFEAKHTYIANIKEHSPRGEGLRYPPQP